MLSTQPIVFHKNLTGGLGKPSKMPGASYGLPALTSCATGRKLSKKAGTVCSSCYACKGRYVTPVVQAAQARRLASIDDPGWVDSMVALIGRKRSKFFRWHDSGDLISVEHLSKICQIAIRLPRYMFWLPTQEHVLVSKFCQNHSIPANLVIRLSTPKIDGRPVTTDLCTSSVYRDSDPLGHACPAPTQGGKCRDCRACWSSSVKHVSYKAH
jgi:hypothetical protein